MTSRTASEPRDLSPTAAKVRLLVLIVVVAGAAVVAVGTGPSVETIRGWVAGSGWVAPFVFTLLYALLTVAMVPGAVLTLAAGVLFGIVAGTLVTLVGATAGATIAFMAARTGGRRAVERLASGRVARVDRWLGDRGLAAVISLRLVPLVPFNAANYAAGISAIRSRDFVVGTAIGIIPGTVVYTSLGAGFSDPTGPLFVGAMIALTLLTIGGSVVVRRSRRNGSEQAANPVGASARDGASS